MFFIQTWQANLLGLRYNKTHLTNIIYARNASANRNYGNIFTTLYKVKRVRKISCKTSPTWKDPGYVWSIKIKFLNVFGTSTISNFLFYIGSFFRHIDFIQHGPLTSHFTGHTQSCANRLEIKRQLRISSLWYFVYGGGGNSPPAINLLYISSGKREGSRGLSPIFFFSE